MVDMETATYRDRFASDGYSVKATLGPVGRAHTSSTEDAMLSSDTRSQIVDRYQVETMTVAYEDMANPRRVGTVVEHRGAGFLAELRIAWDDDEGGETWSDLRQAGWNLAQPETCRGGHWPLSEYGPICPSCVADGLG